MLSSKFIGLNPCGRKIWNVISEMYLDKLFSRIVDKEIDIVLTMSPSQAIDNLGKHLHDGHRMLYSWTRYRNPIEYPDFDTESTPEQVNAWRDEVWPEILLCMIDVSYDIGEYLKYHYDEKFANDYLSLAGKVDYEVIYGMIFKNTEDQDNDSQSDIGSDSDYEPEY